MYRGTRITIMGGLKRRKQFWWLSIQKVKVMIATHCGKSNRKSKICSEMITSLRHLGQRQSSRRRKLQVKSRSRSFKLRSQRLIRYHLIRNWRKTTSSGRKIKLSSLGLPSRMSSIAIQVAYRESRRSRSSTPKSSLIGPNMTRRAGQSLKASRVSHGRSRR